MLVAGCFNPDMAANKACGSSTALTKDRIYADYKEMAEKESKREDRIDLYPLLPELPSLPGCKNIS